MSIPVDQWLSEDGPVALVLCESLEPASGKDAVFFPPTFAAPEGSDQKPNYVIDENHICLIDSVGSQANRLEPMFKRPDLASLVPEFTVKVGNRIVNILDVGHRAADAVVRLSDQSSKIRDAFLAYRDRGDATPLAKIAPTSLVFGAWDSRDTGAKIPRLIESTIRAYGVERLSRSAQYFAVLEKEELENLGLDTLGQKELSNQGLSDSPSGLGPGGVVAREAISREALLNLVALRSIGGPDPAATRAVQEYILGLSLVAFLAPTQLYLRQGCLLVAAPEIAPTSEVVWRTGKRETIDILESHAISFAREASRAFGVGGKIEALFDPGRAESAKRKKGAQKKSKASADANESRV